MAYRTSAAGGTTLSNTIIDAILTPALDDLFVVFALEPGTTNTASLVSDNNGGTYRKVASVTYTTGVVSCWIRETLLTNTTSTDVAYLPADPVSTGAEMVVVAISGAFGSDSAKVRQYNTNSGTAGAATTTFSAAALTGNITLTALGDGTNPPGLTAPTSWTNRQNVGQTNPLGLIVATRDSGFTGTAITWGSNPATNWGMISIEIDANEIDGKYQNLSFSTSKCVGVGTTGLEHTRQNSFFPRARTASSMMSIDVTQNTNFTVPVMLRGVGSDLGVAGLSSAITVKLRKAGGAYTTISPTITDRGGGVYDLALTSSHTDTLGVAALRVSATSLPGLENVCVNDDVLLNIMVSAGTGDVNVVTWKGQTIPTPSVTGVPIVDTKYESGTVQPAPTVAGIPKVEEATLESRLSSARAGYLDNLSAGAAALQSTATAIKAKTDNLPATPASQSDVTAVPAAVWALATSGHTSAGSFGELMAILGGLSHQNSKLDKTVYNAKKLLTSARLRVFASKAAADASTDDNTDNTDSEVYRFLIMAVDEGDGTVKSYKLTRDL